jgi:hypothetical protein
MAEQVFRPGDTVIWMRNMGGGFVFPVMARVVAVTPKRVTITADDPEEKGEGVVTRHVSPDSLQPHEPIATLPPNHAVSGGRRSKKSPPPSDSFFE